MTTLRAAVAASLRKAAQHNSNGQTSPAAILWPDPERAWEEVIPILQEAVPVCSLGDWEPGHLQGPAIWIRALLAGRLSIRDDVAKPDGKTPWIIYLPGWSRTDLRAVETAPQELQPLAELQYRAQWWQQQNGQPWTPQAFLGSPQGAGMSVSKDSATVAALQDGLLDMMDHSMDELIAMGRIDAARIQQLILPDDVVTVLRWMNDPQATEKAMPPARWKAFTALTASQYAVDPNKDSVLTAGVLLGARNGKWKSVWERFVENPTKFPNIPDLLDKAKPDHGVLFDNFPDSWPSTNADAESSLRAGLAGLSSKTAADAAAAIRKLETEHGPRRDWVWASLDRSPLARALEFLVGIAEHAASGVPGGPVEELSNWYSSSGWTVDDLAIRALAAARSAADRAAVSEALGAVYGPWLETTATKFQQAAVESGYQGQTGLQTEAGTCVLFVDGLRMDVGHRLHAELTALDIEATIEHRLAAFPTVTPTGKPAVAPFSVHIGAGPAFAAGNANGTGLEGAAFQKALKESGVHRLLEDEIGDPNGRGWTEAGDLDSIGHAHGHKLTDRLAPEIELIAERIQQLLEGGWKRVIVVTDHGWLLAPSTLRKVPPTPMHLTEGEKSRKERVARLSASASGVTYPTIAWTWDSSVLMTSAPGAGSFETGVIYTHGGLSPQECVIPVVTATAGHSVFEGKIEALKWTGMRCRVDVVHARDDLTVEIRLASGDSGTRIAGPKPIREGEAKLLVADDSKINHEVYVVLLSEAGNILSQAKTTVGGEA